MIRVRFTDAGGAEFGLDIRLPDGKAISVTKVFDICNDYLRTLVSLTSSDYEKFTFSGGSMHVEFDTDDGEVRP